MGWKPDSGHGAVPEQVVHAMTELGKGIRTASFYPAGHPALTQAISRIVAAIEDVPPPETGLEIDVTRNALLYRDTPLPSTNKPIEELNRDLYLRSASKLILLPGQKADEMVAFLAALNRDSRDLQDEGGLEKVLLRGKISRIWVNRVDYEGLTEILKQDDPDALDEHEGAQLPDDPSPDIAPPEEPTIDELLERLTKETDEAAYRGLVVSLSAALVQERSEPKIEYSERALAIFVDHLERPPGNNPEIAALARLGIQELVSDELVNHYIRLLRDRTGRSRSEVEPVLAAFGDRAVKPLLATLAEEEDLFVRKTIIEIIVAIGAPAVPAILDNLDDSRWYVVRNMVTILGNLGDPELAPRIAGALSHPDLRVKKEAIRGLAKLPHPSAVTTLAQLCFFPEESTALTATAALSFKREDEAVLALYRRAVRKRVLFPSYRLAHEAIDSLRSIDTDQAVAALEEILRATAVWETANFREIKKHALQSISRMSGNRPQEIVRRMRSAPKAYLRHESERILKRRGW